MNLSSGVCICGLPAINCQQQYTLYYYQAYRELIVSLSCKKMTENKVNLYSADFSFNIVTLPRELKKISALIKNNTNLFSLKFSSNSFKQTSG